MEITRNSRQSLEDRAQLINTTLDAIEAAAQSATPTVNLIYTVAYDALFTELERITAKLEGRPYLTHEEALHLIDLGNEHTEKLYADISTLCWCEWACFEQNIIPLNLIAVVAGANAELAVTLFNRLWAEEEEEEDRIELAFKNYLAENE